MKLKIHAGSLLFLRYALNYSKTYNAPQVASIEQTYFDATKPDMLSILKHSMDAHYIGDTKVKFQRV